MDDTMQSRPHPDIWNLARANSSELREALLGFLASEVDTFEVAASRCETASRAQIRERLVKRAWLDDEKDTLTEAGQTALADLMGAIAYDRIEAGKSHGFFYVELPFPTWFKHWLEIERPAKLEEERQELERKDRALQVAGWNRFTGIIRDQHRRTPKPANAPSCDLEIRFAERLSLDGVEAEEAKPLVIEWTAAINAQRTPRVGDQFAGGLRVEGLTHRIRPAGESASLLTEVRLRGAEKALSPEGLEQHYESMLAEGWLVRETHHRLWEWSAS